MPIITTHIAREQSTCADLSCHFRKHLEQLFKPLDVVAEAVANVNAFEYLVVMVMRGTSSV